MTQKGDDCYFYYYSSCKKESACPFRHEPLSRGTEAICEDWEFGRCLKEHCQYRHMRIQVNRSTIPCYWESQPAGCQKPHCVFRHSKGKKAAAATPTQAESDTTNVPSPKVEQILIHMADTDEESPQKGGRLRPAVSGNSPSKRFAVIKRLDNKVDNSMTDLDKTQVAEAKHSSQRLEDELLAFAKQGISVLPSSEVTKANNNGHKPVKVKSLKDIKREKILKARLEYERKKLLASQQTEDVNEIPSRPTTKAHKTVEAKNTVRQRPANIGKAVQPAPISSQSNITHRVSKSTAEKISAQSDLSTNLEVSNSSANPVAEVRVKSFSEIMEEKRQRLGEVQSIGSHGDIKASVDDTVKRPIIAPRRLKLHSAVSRKPIRLKRKAPHDPLAEVSSKAKVKSTIDDKGNGETERVLPTGSSKVLTGCTVEGDSSELQAQPISGSSPKQSSTNERFDLESDDELDLLDGSSHFKTNTTQSPCSDVDDDDDDFMNEMEQLLA